MDFPQKSPNDSSHHIMMLSKFWALSEINSSKKLDISSLLEVGSINGVIGALQSSNMVGGAIRWVLREIQYLELCHAPTTPFTERTSDELEIANFFDPLISDLAQTWVAP